jgi:hypothetical protein
MIGVDKQETGKSRSSNPGTEQPAGDSLPVARTLMQSRGIRCVTNRCHKVDTWYLGEVLQFMTIEYLH